MDVIAPARGIPRVRVRRAMFRCTVCSDIGECTPASKYDRDGFILSTSYLRLHLYQTQERSAVMGEINIALRIANIGASEIAEPNLGRHVGHAA